MQQKIQEQKTKKETTLKLTKLDKNILTKIHGGSGNPCGGTSFQEQW